MRAISLGHRPIPPMWAVEWQVRDQVNDTFITAVSGSNSEGSAAATSETPAAASNVARKGVGLRRRSQTFIPLFFWLETKRIR